MIDLEKMLAEVDRQLAENQRWQQPVWILVAITGVAVFTAGAAVMKLFG